MMLFFSTSGRNEEFFSLFEELDVFLHCANFTRRKKEEVFLWKVGEIEKIKISAFQIRIVGERGSFFIVSHPFCVRFNIHPPTYTRPSSSKSHLIHPPPPNRPPARDEEGRKEGGGGRSRREATSTYHVVLAATP